MTKQSVVIINHPHHQLRQTVSPGNRNLPVDRTHRSYKATTQPRLPINRFHTPSGLLGFFRRASSE